MLDLGIADSFAKLLKTLRGRSATELRGAQRDFIAERNARFGKPGYDLRLALQRRLDTLRDAAH